MPATTRYAYFNTGTSGPLSLAATEAIRAQVEREFTEGRIERTSAMAAMQARENARQAVAGLIGCTPEEIALTHHTTEGMNIVTWGIDWQPGDEAVTTNIEHAGGLLPLYAVRKARGVTVRFVDLHYGDVDAVAALEKMLTPRTRLISLSHVSYATGAVLPLAEIVTMAHRHGVPVLVDGAQSVGAIPVDVKDIGVDYYSLSGQKWLCGPEGTGALYVRFDKLDTVRQTFVGYSSFAGRREEDDATEEMIPHPAAKRFEVGTRHAPDFAGQAAAIGWLREEVGTGWAFARIRSLAERARERLSAVDGVEVLTPGTPAGLICFTVDGVDAKDLVIRLAERKFVIRSIRDPYCARVSTGYFNTEDEVDRLAEAVADIRREKRA
jgi:L-cysteine/cystine lyase